MQCSCTYMHGTVSPKRCTMVNLMPGHEPGRMAGTQSTTTMTNNHMVDSVARTTHAAGNNWQCFLIF